MKLNKHVKTTIQKSHGSNHCNEMQTEYFIYKESGWMDCCLIANHLAVDKVYLRGRSAQKIQRAATLRGCRPNLLAHQATIY